MSDLLYFEMSDLLRHFAANQQRSNRIEILDQMINTTTNIHNTRFNTIHLFTKNTLKQKCTRWREREQSKQIDTIHERAISIHPNRSFPTTLRVICSLKHRLSDRIIDRLCVIVYRGDWVVYRDNHDESHCKRVAQSINCCRRCCIKDTSKCRWENQNKLQWVRLNHSWLHLRSYFQLWKTDFWLFKNTANGIIDQWLCTKSKL